jgi:hypothetical protein
MKLMIMKMVLIACWITVMVLGCMSGRKPFSEAASAQWLLISWGAYAFGYAIGFLTRI